MEIPIIYEDEELVVLDKPAGVVCNRAVSVKEETLQDWWESKFKTDDLEIKTEEEKYFFERSGLVHRLDKETSGVMVMAKTPQTFSKLLAQFKAREVHKEYLALTHGIWSTTSGQIKLPIGRAQHNRQMMAVREDGRESMTEFAQVRVWKNLCEETAKKKKVNTKGYGGFSLVRFSPHTGRMHQIRVHAKQMGHPLVGDEVYAGRKRSREDRKWCERLMLNAIKLELTHPERGRMQFVSRIVAIEQTCKDLC